VFYKKSTGGHRTPDGIDWLRQRMDQNMAKTALVIGGGPAGLMAAQELLAHGLSVQLTDAMPTLGRKFLMAGKSGLNLTKDETPPLCLSHYDTDRLAPMINAFGPRDVMNWANALGTAVFTGSTGRVFPKVGKASPLLRAWIAQLVSHGLDIRTKWRLTNTDGRSFIFSTPNGAQTITPDVTILALGGASWARLGSDGTWPAILPNVATAPFAPSNCAFAFDWSAHMHKFLGQPIKSIVMRAGTQVSRGEIILSAKGIEGGGIYPLSPALRHGERLIIDLMPDWQADKITTALARPRGKNSLSNHIRKTLKLDPAKLAMIREFWGSLPHSPEILAQVIKGLTLTPLSPRPTDEAISTAGGIRWDALDDGLMIRALPGVFAAGEMIDWDAPTGGYLLTACFATGKWAGTHAARFAITGGSQ
jgi:uncharacterized flavoprotein (TIGR03862 family)